MKVFVVATIIALIGTCLSLIEGMGSLYLGRLIYGLGCGVLSVCAPLYFEETVPSKLYSQYQPVYLTS